MYYAHFGLTQPPFRITPDTEFFFGGGNRGPILEALIYAISQGEGIIKVTGEVGSGKTMLCNMLQSRLPANVETAYIANPSVSPEEIVQAVALELHLQPPRGASHLDLMQLIHAHLLERHAAGRQVVMFVEESQSMPIATLEEIRLLSNLETASSKLLQIVLFGQPELDDNLSQANIRQLRERITHSFCLSPLKTDEIGDYLDFRLRAAGYHGPDLFSKAVINAMAKASGGLTRRINLIADKTLLAAFAEATHTVNLQHVKAAIRDCEFSHYASPATQRGPGFVALIFGVGALIGVGMFTLAEHFQQAPTSAENATQRHPDAVAGAASSVTAESQATATPAATAPEITDPPDTQKPAEQLSRASEKAAVTSAPALAVEKGGLVEARIRAGTNWLAAEGNNAYTIQLLGTGNPEQLINHLNLIAKYVEINEVFVYRTLIQQKPSLNVLYGSFADRGAAQEALKQLPAALTAPKPFVRTAQGIRTEIAQNQLP